jgi:hypothetical protein
MGEAEPQGDLGPFGARREFGALAKESEEFVHIVGRLRRRLRLRMGRPARSDGADDKETDG